MRVDPPWGHPVSLSIVFFKNTLAFWLYAFYHRKTLTSHRWK